MSGGASAGGSDGGAVCGVVVVTGVCGPRGVFSWKLEDELVSFQSFCGFSVRVGAFVTYIPSVL